MLKAKIDGIQEACLLEINNASDLQQINAIKIKYLGRNGEITAVLKSIKEASVAERPQIGKWVNDAQKLVEGIIADKENSIQEILKQKRTEEETLDVTLSLPQGRSIGALNPLTLIKNDITDIFIRMGFEVKDGPEIEFEYYNFTALNIPKDHPSRNNSDTFYISDNLLLRTQTSAVQVHVMKSQRPPIRIICPGKVYRPDDDATHSPMFQQIEGLVVDTTVTLRDLKSILEEFARLFFSETTKVRFRPSYFPFTEPSVEVDLSCNKCGGAGCNLCKSTGWIELLGAGVVHPNVLEECGIDSSKYKGIAFGIGVERAAMIKYGIHDMRLLFDNDIRILKQFK
ncbi:MAG: phenylalanine--tRNA ligase subunit alpha [Christensenellaceae bacterium]|jgi:phenylalanyl-tRNA synthetase alpha chain|nr:phenylalanine--tRNA ligase subunit alpha [Christensenellaceae bacterium]